MILMIKLDSDDNIDDSDDNDVDEETYNAVVMCAEG